MLDLNVVILNAALENIPVAAIARIVKQPLDDVYATLKEFRDYGSITELPRPDWPPTARIADHLPAVPLPSEADMTFLCSKAFRLTMLEAAFLGALLRHRQVEKSRLHGIVEHQRAVRPNQPGNMEATDPKMVDVMICKLRKKLKTVDPMLKIETIWGSGYYIEPVVKPLIIERLNGDPNEPPKEAAADPAPDPAGARPAPVAAVGDAAE